MPCRRWRWKRCCWPSSGADDGIAREPVARHPRRAGADPHAGNARIGAGEDAPVRASGGLSRWARVAGQRAGSRTRASCRLQRPLRQQAEGRSRHPCCWFRASPRRWTAPMSCRRPSSAAGGRVLHAGMPVDPGNLLVLGEIPRRRGHGAGGGHSHLRALAEAQWLRFRSARLVAGIGRSPARTSWPWVSAGC